jgi:mono/diheme cytochrome c family protein
MSRIGWFLIVLVLLLGAAGTHAYYRLDRVAPPPRFESPADHFLYGSIGNEDTRGIPYWIWLVLPRIFPQYLPGPGGYASVGIFSRDGAEMPIGLSKVEIGVPRVGINCAFCHTATVRARPTDVPVVYPGAPANGVGPQEYLRFLVRAASDPSFSAGTILREISRNVNLPLPDRLLYRFVLIPETRRALLALGGEAASAQGPDWGRGRSDQPNRAKMSLLGQPVYTTVGAADMMPLWHLKSREAHGYQWDRSNTSLREIVRSSAAIEGAPAGWLDTDTAMWDRTDGTQRSSLRRIEEYLNDLAPPKYPFAVDAALAAVGAATYAATCAECHDANGARANTAIALAEIGTDRSRLEAWSARSSELFNAYGEGRDWQFSRFRPPSSGYVAPSLDGVWLNAPYLHNGSVPTLSALLDAPPDRPARFWRGYDVYDQQRVGFVSDDAEAQRVGTPFDASRPGNGNGGHAYGTTLSADQKRALLEYLKTR